MLAWPLSAVCHQSNREKEREQVLTPNICLRSGSLNLKGMLETWSLLGCDLFSVFSDDCVCCWLSVCAESSVCCGEKGKEIREYQLVSLVNFDAPTVNKLNAKMSLSVAEKQLSLHTGVDRAIDVFFYLVHRGAAVRRYSLACLHLQVFPGCRTQSLVLTIQLVKTFTTCFCRSFSGRYENHM